MPNPNKLTRDRLESLIKQVRQELAAFQIGPFVTEPLFGVVDVDMFGLRFKFITNSVQNDDRYLIIPIAKDEDVDSDTIFLALASSGYLRWLREQISSNAYLKILSYRDRWKLILDTALPKMIEQKKGKYMIQRVKDLKEMPFMRIYHEDPEVFDWLLR
jgi:hypothetical protein